MLNFYVILAQDTAVALVTIIILLLIVFGVAISFYLQKKHTDFVIANSQLLRNLESLNQKYYFHAIQQQYKHIKTFHSKSTYDKARFSDILNEFVLNREKFITENLYYAENNTRTYRMYCNECDRLRKENNYSAAYYQNNFFIEIEDKLFCEKKKHPVIKFEVSIIKQYTSPQGRNHYEDHRIYTALELQNALNNAIAQKERQKTQTENRQTERAKMSPKLRHTILERDGFRCCHCGARAADGAKLHVDHIKPIAKGGKTEPSNLQTLCDLCNLGKGANYTPY